MLNKDRLLKESIVLLSADLYQTIYDHEHCGGWGDAIDTIISLAEKFENELNWKDYEERDYLKELEKFEQKVINDLNNGRLL